MKKEKQTPNFGLASSAAPNGLRLSGERSGAERVRCSRGLGRTTLHVGFVTIANPDLNILQVHRDVQIDGRLGNDEGDGL